MTKRSTCRITSAPTRCLLGVVLLDDALPERVADLLGALVGEIEAGVVARVEAEDARHVHLQRVEVPFLGVHLLARIRLDGIVENVLGEHQQIRARIDLVDCLVVLLVLNANLALEQLAAQRVDVLALLVHDVVVLEEVFSGAEVLRLDLFLRALDRLGHHAVLDRHAVFHSQALHEPGDAIGSEDAHQVVFERQVEPRRARDLPGGRRGRAADCRCGALRDARCR